MDEKLRRQEGDVVDAVARASGAGLPADVIARILVRHARAISRSEVNALEALGEMREQWSEDEE